jgi:hypothetical protein
MTTTERHLHRPGHRPSRYLPDRIAHAGVLGALL